MYVLVKCDTHDHFPSTPYPTQVYYVCASSASLYLSVPLSLSKLRTNLMKEFTLTTYAEVRKTTERIPWVVSDALWFQGQKATSMSVKLTSCRE